MLIENKLKKLPNTPGIYLFYNKKKELIYVGKATSLRSRVSSYFRGARTSRPIEQMIHKIADIKVKETDSVLEAVILEANYIKKYQPKYNVDGKDDKSWNYIVITNDEYPSVKTVRSHEFDKQIKQNEQRKHIKHLFGPYPGLKTREMMKLLRRLFSVSTCRPNKNSKPCLYYQMEQCLGVCTGEISSADYKRKVIRPLVTFLGGGKKRLVKSFIVQMKKAAKEENFEEAARLRNQIGALERIHDIALLNKSFFDHQQSTINDRGSLIVDRVEGYDISNLGDKGKVGSMVVFDQSGPVKSQYRKFKIKTVEGQSDVDCLDEVLRRRLRHSEWTFPNIFLIDGGKPQVNRVKKILQELKIDIPVVGIAKGAARKKNEFIFATKNRDLIKWVNQNQDLLIQVRDEAHRFAIQYQRKLRKL